MTVKKAFQYRFRQYWILMKSEKEKLEFCNTFDDTKTVRNHLWAYFHQLEALLDIAHDCKLPIDTQLLWNKALDYILN